MKMRIYVLSIVLLLSGIQIAFAHPASKVDVSYNLNDQILVVVAEHNTKDVTKHWIDQIIVQLNGKEIIQQVFVMQMDREKQKATYLIPGAKEGDEIVVIARCNVHGKKKVKITVESK